MTPEPPEARRARDRLVAELARNHPDLDRGVLEVLRRIPRHLFMPGASLGEAYDDHAHAIGEGQTISQPTVVALMTSALELTGRERVLEIGTGSGYQTAVLAELAREVYSIERVERLAREARERLSHLGCGNVQVRSGDGSRGRIDEAPFDRIVLTAAPARLPETLLDQLAAGGILVAPVGDEEQWLRVWKRMGSGYETRCLCPVRFVPLVS